VFLIRSERAPLRPEPRLTGQLRDQYPVSLRTFFDYVFEYRT
jgi:hypothetical protein